MRRLEHRSRLGIRAILLAAELSLDAVCGLVRIEQTGGQQLQVERRLDGGRREVLAVTGPAVLSVEGTTARLRCAPLRGVLHARRPPWR